MILGGKKIPENYKQLIITKKNEFVNVRLADRVGTHTVSNYARFVINEAIICSISIQQTFANNEQCGY